MSLLILVMLLITYIRLETNINYVKQNKTLCSCKFRLSGICHSPRIILNFDQIQKRISAII